MFEDYYAKTLGIYPNSDIFTKLVKKDLELFPEDVASHNLSFVENKAVQELRIHPDCHLLGCFVDGNYYYDTCLPMGCYISCRYFELFSCFLEWLVKFQTGSNWITHYLEDFLFVGLAGSDICEKVLFRFCELRKLFWVPLSEEKTVGPVTCLCFLGIEIDSVNKVFRLPSEKIAKLIEKNDGFLSIRNGTLVQMQSLLGLLAFACRVMPMGRIFSHRLAMATRGIRLLHHRIRLGLPLIEYLKVWSSFLLHYNGYTCFQSEEKTGQDISLFADAAGSVGFGVIFHDQWCAERWPDNWFMNGWTRNLTLLELFPLVVAVVIWGEQLRNKHTCFWSDNESVVHVFFVYSSDQADTVPSIEMLTFEYMVPFSACSGSFGISLQLPVNREFHDGIPMGGVGNLLLPLVRASVAPSTWNAYGKAWQEWWSFANNRPVDTSRGERLEVTEAYLQHLHASGALAAVVRKRLSGLSFHFKLRGWEDVTNSFILRQALKGWKCSGDRQVFSLLAQIIDNRKSVCSSIFESILFSSAFGIAFSGALRVRELAAASAQKPGGLQQNDVFFCNGGIRIRIWRSKTDYLGSGLSFPLFSIAGPVCPINLVTQYLAIKPDSPSFFVHKDGSPLTRFQLLAVLRRILGVLGLPPGFSRTSVWILSHSYVFWAEQRAELWPGGRSLGFHNVDFLSLPLCFPITNMAASTLSGARVRSILVSVARRVIDCDLWPHSVTCFRFPALMMAVDVCSAMAPCYIGGLSTALQNALAKPLMAVTAAYRAKLSAIEGFNSTDYTAVEQGERLQYKTLTMTYKVIRNLGPPYICDLISRYLPARNLRSSQDLLLYSPLISSSHNHKQDFSRASPLLWNPLPQHIRLSSTIETFKKNLKTYLRQACNLQ
ncbi:unnamed protein product [Ranitomeya imitator]|uniref:Reverse transcriptase domain-containing protein n=1 Tax=Ranitomeya imitator TaxID=111125 RepID=A0ABN9L6H9_9NEOB|nr:unnamed protein product [Ranitomeya imitator]